MLEGRVWIGGLVSCVGPHPKSFSRGEKDFDSDPPSPLGSKGLGDEGSKTYSTSTRFVKIAITSPARPVDMSRLQSFTSA